MKKINKRSFVCKLMGRKDARLAQNVAASAFDEAEKSGLTKRELADRIGMDPSQLSRILNARAPNMELETVCTVLRGMNQRLVFSRERAEPSTREEPVRVRDLLTLVSTDTNVIQLDHAQEKSRSVSNTDIKLIMSEDDEITNELRA